MTSTVNGGVDLEEHLFRREAGRMLASLTRLFGVHNLALAEDVVQDALCRALEVWKLRGVPDNPSAWLMTAAKNRALDVLRHERKVRTFTPELTRSIESDRALAPILHEAFEPTAIRDDQLRMIFSCCHPRLPEDAQVALILHILCGFSVDEVAGAFLATHAAIEKRIARAKKTLAGSAKLFELDGEEDFAARLAVVHRAIYLLFNEGYHGAGATHAVRAELCEEAIHLAALLRAHPLAATPATSALSSLMCLHVARLSSRVDAGGNLNTLYDQDRSTWDPRRIAEGLALLDASAQGPELTEYHVEAAIASIHACSPSVAETPWSRIAKLYETLMTIRPSPVIALNRAIAIAESEGPERGLEAIAAIEERERLRAYPFYFAALGELELRAGRTAIAGDHFRSAHALARNAMERRFLARRIAATLSTTT